MQLNASQKISAQILQYAVEHATAHNQSIQDSIAWAYDRVLGIGSFGVLAAELQHEFNKKQGA